MQDISYPTIPGIIIPYNAALAVGINPILGAPVKAIIDTSTCNLVLTDDFGAPGGTVTKFWKDTHVLIPGLGEADTRRAYLLGEMQIGIGIQSAEAYLGVTPIGVVETPNMGLRLVEMPTLMPELGGDWGLRMVQFPQAERWDHRLERGEIIAAEVKTVVAKIVDYHMGLPRSAEADALADPVNFDQAVRANDFGVMARCGIAPPGLLEDLSWHEHRFLTERANLIVDRINAGMVRDGHGDPKLTNTYMPAGYILDGISFHRPWSCNDVATDVAYQALGFALGDAKHFDDWLAVINAAYSSRVGEQLMDNPVFWNGLNYRAWVEAKVAGLEGRIADAQPLLALANNSLRTAFSLAGLEW